MGVRIQKRGPGLAAALPAMDAVTFPNLTGAIGGHPAGPERLRPTQ
jgi:hypothetical protein